MYNKLISKIEIKIRYNYLYLWNINHKKYLKHRKTLNKLINLELICVPAF